MQRFPTIRSLKQGTKFIHYGKDDVKLICIAGTKRGYCRDVFIEGQDGTFSMLCDDTVELVNPKTS